MDWREQLSGWLLTAYLAVVVAVLLLPVVLVLAAIGLWDRVMDWCGVEQ